eukprot:m.131074 g.131074  ORF g.131074 m.131074 type:complete len:53 (+) comp15898_c0_seq1:161-319(+)
MCIIEANTSAAVICPVDEVGMKCSATVQATSAVPPTICARCYPWQHLFRSYW